MSSVIFPPTSSSTDWLRQGRLALRQGRPTEARHALLAALAADPRNEQAWLQLSRLSSPRARLAYLARVLELNPTNTLAHQELRHARRSATPVGARSRPWAGARRWSGLVLLLVGVIGLSSVGAWLQLAARPPQPKAAFGLALSMRQTATPVPTQTATWMPTPTRLPTETATAVPVVEATVSGERWIDVNLTTQTVTAYTGASPLQTFIVSTGTWQYPTVTGEYRIYVKYASADMAGPGYYLPAVPYVMYFYEGYGLHGTYWHNNFGTPMSHGCVNLRTDEAAWLFEWASVGTVVNVHY